MTSEAKKSVKDQLTEAAALLRKHGHVKNTEQDSTGRMCMIGSLLAANYGHERESRLPAGWSIEIREATFKVAGFLGLNQTDRTGRPDFMVAGYAIADWNNRPECTEAEVIAALEGAAASCVTH